MNVKIQGGGSGAYANSGSSYGTINYLKHEDSKRIAEGKEREPFFNAREESVQASKAVEQLDQNKGQLGKSDAKFFVITVSPSKKEQEALGATEAERTANFKEYINKDVMQKYAEGFGKGHNAQDLMYYAKVHHSRDKSQEGEMHAHIVVSRKDANNKIKMSPQTNHRNAKRSGNVKGGFDRTEFYKNCESSFDKRFEYKREFEQSFEYQNAVKKGTPQELQRVGKKKAEIRQNKIVEQANIKLKQARAERERKKAEKQERTKHKERTKKRGRGLSM